MSCVIYHRHLVLGSMASRTSTIYMGSSATPAAPLKSTLLRIWATGLKLAAATVVLQIFNTIWESHNLLIATKGWKGITSTQSTYAGLTPRQVKWTKSSTYVDFRSRLVPQMEHTTFKVIKGKCKIREPWKA